MMALTAALVLSNRQLWEQAHACVQNLPVRIALEQDDPADADALLDRIERHRSDVVLLEAARLTLPLEEFVRRLRETGSQAAVFVLHPEASPQHIHEALRAGATEFLYPPIAESLKNAFERLSNQRARTTSSHSNGLGKVYGFISARGGCGATTFAAHVAASLLKHTTQPVLLADLDFEAGLLRFITKSKSTYSVRDALDNMHRMDASFWKALVSVHPNQLEVITAPDDLAARRQPDARETPHLMRFIRSLYSASVVDFGRHRSNAAFDSLPELETLFVVTTMDLDTLDRTRECIAAAAERGFGPSCVKVLVNRAPEKSVPDIVGIRNYLGTAPFSVFVSDYAALYEAWSEGRLLAHETRLARELDAFAGVLAGKTSPAAAPAGLKKLFGFLQRPAQEAI